MGGTIEWNALPIMVEMLGVADVDLFIRQLVVIRNHLNRPESSDA